MKRIFYSITILAFVICSHWTVAQVIGGGDVVNGFSIENTEPAPKIEASLVISPNPTTNKFSISNGDAIGKVEVYNIIGAKLKSFDTRESTSFDVIDLPSGIYLVRAYDKQNARVLATLRLKKR